MMKLRLITAAIVAMSACACARTAPVMPIPLVADYIVEGQGAPSQDIASEMARLGVRTLAYKAIHHGTPGKTVTLGEDPLQGRAEPLFQVASISKSVSAMGIMKLVEQRELDLDRDINGYLKSWKIDYSGHPAGTMVTIRQLLSHTGGLNVHGFGGYAPGAAIPDTVAVLRGRGNTEAVKLVQAPGKGFSYSGGGTTVLQLLIEDQTGTSFTEFMERAVLTPLGMRHSHYRDTPGAPYVPATGGQGEDMGAPYHIYPEKAAASLWATPSDLARFLLAADAVIAGERPGFLKPALARQLVQVPGGALKGYALGFTVDRGPSHEIIGHTGSNFGYKALMLFDREKKDGFVAVSGSERGFLLAERLARGFAQGRGLPYEPTRRIVPVAQTEADWARIAGTWIFAPGTPHRQTLALARIAGDILTARNTASGETFNFVANGPMQFIDPERRVPLTFAAGPDGRLTGLAYGEVPVVRAD